MSIPSGVTPASRGRAKNGVSIASRNLDEPRARDSGRSLRVCKRVPLAKARIFGEIHGMAYWEYQLPELARHYRCFTYNCRRHVGTQITPYGFSMFKLTPQFGACDREPWTQIRSTSWRVRHHIRGNYAIPFLDPVKGLILVAWSKLRCDEVLRSPKGLQRGSNAAARKARPECIYRPAAT
jgi:hypothetical protein